MHKKKQTKKQRITQLEKQLEQAHAQQAHSYHFASQTIDKASTDRLMASGVILKLEFIGGKEVFSPVCIKDGLSPETIAAIKADLVRSYELATAFKPK